MPTPAPPATRPPFWQPYHTVWAILFLGWLATGVILFLATPLSRLLGSRGLVAIERLMGMLLVVVAVEMILSGLRQYLG